MATYPFECDACAFKPRPPKPGDLVCGECWQGNDPARKSCSRCGYTLSEAEVAGAQVTEDPWWRRTHNRRCRKIKFADYTGEIPDKPKPGFRLAGQGQFCKKHFRRAKRLSHLDFATALAQLRENEDPIASN